MMTAVKHKNRKSILDQAFRRREGFAGVSNSNVFCFDMHDKKAKAPPCFTARLRLCFCYNYFYAVTHALIYEDKKRDTSAYWLGFPHAVCRRRAVIGFEALGRVFLLRAVIPHRFQL